MKINNFRGELTDLSAQKEALVNSFGTHIGGGFHPKRRTIAWPLGTTWKQDLGLDTYFTILWVHNVARNRMLWGEDPA